MLVKITKIPMLKDTYEFLYVDIIDNLTSTIHHKFTLGQVNQILDYHISVGREIKTNF